MAGAGVEAAPVPYELKVQPITPRVQAVEHRDSLRNGTLEDVITHLRDDWQKEGLPENWTDLPGVGFMIGYQMGFLKSPKLKDLSLDRKKELWISLTEYSLRNWVGEYLAQRVVLPGLFIIEFEDGRWKLKDPLHGAGFDLEETFSKRERNGVPYNTFMNIIKAFFATAADGSTAVVPSPSGEGMPDENGVKLHYPDSHHTFLEKQGRYIYTYTICSDFDYAEEAELIKELRGHAGQEIPQLTKDSSGEAFIANPALFDSSHGSFTVQDLINAMAKVREKKKTHHLYRDKTFDDALSDVKDWNALWDYDGVTQAFISQWVDYSRDMKNWTYKNVKEALAVTILRLSRYVLRKEEEKKIRKLRPDLPQNIIPLDPRLLVGGYSFGATLKRVGEIPGCAGGGQGLFSRQFNKALKAIFGEGEKSVCQDCGESSTDAHYHCPGCNKKYEGETSSDPKDWTQKCLCGYVFPCGKEVHGKAN